MDTCNEQNLHLILQTFVIFQRNQATFVIREPSSIMNIYRNSMGSTGGVVATDLHTIHLQLKQYNE